MPTFGDFETVGEPVAVTEQLGHVSTIWRARKLGSGADPAYAIKCFAPHRRKSKEGQSDDALDKDRGLEFLEGVKQLKKAHTEGVRCLSPIHAFGFADEGAWYVTDFYPRNTVKAWIARRGSVDSGGLRQVVHCVVAGCLGLKRSRGYSHGNLKAANVFLVGKPRPLRTTPLELADAYPAAPLQLARLAGEEKRTVDQLLHEVMEVQDLRALGEMLLQLVEGRLVSSAYDYNYPIAATPAWERLGRDAERWRELCNRLLDPQLSLDKLSLESLAQEFRSSSIRPHLPKILAGAGAVCLILLGVYLGLHLVERGRERRQKAETAKLVLLIGEAKSALERNDFATAIAKSEEALRLKPNSPEANGLKTQAGEKLEAAYQNLFKQAQRELTAEKFDEAERLANLALQLKKGDKAASDLMKGAQTRRNARLTQEEQDSNYDQAIKSAQAAMAQNDFVKAMTEADRATGYRPDDGVAKTLKKEAQAAQEKALAKAEQDRNFKQAMDAAAKWEQTGNFTNALAGYQAAQKLNANDAKVAEKIALLTPKAAEQERLVAETLQRQKQAAAEFGKAVDSAAKWEQAGNFTNALAGYQAAQKLNGSDPQVAEKIRALTPKAAEQERLVAETLQRQKQAAAEFGKAMDSAAKWEQAGNFTNALAGYQAAQKLNASDPQVAEKIRALTPKAAEQERLVAETLQRQKQAAAEFGKAMDSAAKWEQAGNFTNALAGYQAAQKLNASDPKVVEKITLLAPRAAEQERQVAQQAQQQKYEVALTAAKKALDEAKTAMGTKDFVSVDEKIKAGLVQCAIARTNGEVGPVNVVAEALQTIQSNALTARSDEDYRKAENLKQAGQIEDALTLCQGYPDGGKFGNLKKELASMQSAYKAAVTGLTNGNYDFVKTVAADGYDQNPRFKGLMATGREESKQLTALEDLKAKNQWQGVKDGLAQLSPQLLNKASFGQLNKWVEENSPVRSLDRKLDVFKVWFGITDPNGAIIDWLTAAPAIRKRSGAPPGDFYYKELDKLRAEYKALGVLKQREKDLSRIETQMNLWDQ